MSADLLRRAAKVLRVHVADLPVFAQTDWSHDTDEIHAGSAVDDVWLATTLDVEGDEVSSYIALMQPAVALALAEMLERLSPLAPYWHEPYAAPFVPIIEQGIRVARAILREAS